MPPPLADLAFPQATLQSSVWLKFHDLLEAFALLALRAQSVGLFQIAGQVSRCVNAGTANTHRLDERIGIRADPVAR